MKKALLFALLFLPSLCWAGASDPLAKDLVAINYTPKTDAYHIRFTTTVPANTDTTIMSTSTPQGITIPSGITHSPVITSSTTNTYGGRIYSVIQIIDCENSNQKTWVDFDTSDISSTTSFYLYEGQMWSPDSPVAYQGPVVVRSDGWVKITGHMWFDRRTR